MIQRMDKDGDGKVSADELPDQLRERLSAADTNGDGFYDAGELTAAFAAMGGGGGPGAGRGPAGGPPGGGR